MKYSFILHNSPSTGKNILFLDRDGVVIKDTGYPHEIAKLQFHKNVIKELVKFKELNKIETCGFITNQSGVSRGYFSEDQFWETHNYIINECFINGLEIKFTSVNFFEKPNYFRKPSNGMIENVVNFYSAKREKSFLVGDKEIDEEAANKSNIKFINVKNLYK